MHILLRRCTRTIYALVPLYVNLIYIILLDHMHMCIYILYCMYMHLPIWRSMGEIDACAPLYVY